MGQGNDTSKKMPRSRKTSPSGPT